MPSRGTRRVAMLTPFAFPSPSGNAVTVERIASGLSTRGIEPRVSMAGSVVKVAYLP